MSDGREIFDWLKDHLDPLEPTPDAFQRAQNRLEAAIAAEKAPRTRPTAGHRLTVGIAAAIALGVAAVVVGSFLVSDQAEATLTEIANAARQATPVDVPQGSFIFAESTGFNLVGREASEFGLPGDSVSYLLPRTRRVWKSANDEFVMLDVAHGRPTFFDPAAEAAYYEMGLDEIDQVGETVRERFTGVIDPVDEVDWPNNSESLLAEMTRYLGTDPPSTAELVNLAVNLLRERNPSPPLRSATLEVLANLPVDLIEQDNDSVTIGIVDAGRMQAFTFSRVGWLLAETTTLMDGEPQSGLPAGTVTTDIQYQTVKVVQSLPE